MAEEEEEGGYLGGAEEDERFAVTVRSRLPANVAVAARSESASLSRPGASRRHRRGQERVAVVGAPNPPSWPPSSAPHHVTVANAVA